MCFLSRTWGDKVPRIVGGTIVQDRSAFPYQVSLRDDNAPFCGASIIDHRNMLTAAHCVTNNVGDVFSTRDLFVVVGDLNTDRVSPTTVRRQIRYIFVHARYNPSNLRNDIAVLRIDMLTFDANINSIPISRATPSGGTNCTVSGWGYTSYGGPPSHALRFVNVPIVPFANCRVAHGSHLKQGMLCAGCGGKDACSADSGGPLVCNNIQVGIVSWGTNCGHANFPGVYTNVAHYFTWIQIQQERSSSMSATCNIHMIFVNIIISIFLNYKTIKIL